MPARLLLSIVLFSSLTVKSQTNDTLVFATYRYADNNRIKNIEPFATYFGNIAGAPVKVKSYDSVKELIDGMKRGETDIVFINTFGYLLLREQSSEYLLACALRIPEGERSTYQTAIVSAVKTNIVTLEDLKKGNGKFSLLLVNPGSTSGNLIPRLKLAEAGIIEPEKFFKTLTYTKNHALTLNQVAKGEADLGAFGSEEYHKALQEDPTLSKRVNLVWESGPIQLGPVLFKKTLDTQVAGKLSEALLTLHEKSNVAFEAIKSGWTEAIPADKFQTVNESYYDVMLNGNYEEGMKIIRAFAR